MPNGSFEEYDDCPDGLVMQTLFQPANNGFYTVKNWFSPTLGTSDYFNICDTSNTTAGVPKNKTGYQTPQHGNAYCGLVAYWYISIYADYREYLEVELNSSLVSNEKYTWSFYVSLADSSLGAINKIGIVLSDTLVIDYSNTLSAFEFIDIPDVGHSNTIIKDSINWVKIQGEYTAHGGEKYLLLGVFYDSLNIDKEVVGGFQSHPGVYYYIDNVKVCKGECNNNFIIPNVFTPNNDNVNDTFFITTENIENVTIKIYNRWGNEVFIGYDDFNWNGMYNNEECTSGVYFYIINYTNFETNEFEQKQGYIHLIR